MKKTNFIFLLFVCLPLTCFLQEIPNNDFSVTETIVCPFDSTAFIIQPKNWRLYQTLNNKWDGTIDSNYCISVIDDGQDVSIDLGTIDPNKALFVRGLVNSTANQTLIPDQIYEAYLNINKPDSIHFNTSTNCPNNMCSGMIIGIEIPDSTFTSTTTRFYFDMPDDDYVWGDFETCFASEYFETSRLQEFILKFTLDSISTNLDGKLLTLEYSYLDRIYINPLIFGTINAPYYNSTDSSYFITLQEVTGSSWPYANFLLKYGDEDSYPQSDNIYYIEAKPQPNTNEKSTVNLIASDWKTVVFQPFTALRGALVEGSDTLRHEVNLVSNGSDICMSQPIDFIFDDGAKFIYNGGHIDFQGKSGCMMFQNKGALVVGENQKLYYGQNGKGILALMPGGEIHLEENSELIIDNTLWIFGLEDKRYPPIFNIYLKKGNKLIFGENAYISDHFSTYPNTRLNVYMNGGELDDSKLNTASRTLINRIYPKPAEDFSDNFTIYKNPVSTELSFEFIANETGTLTLEIFDMNGRLISSKQLNMEKGINQKQFPLDNIAAGVYAVQFRSGQQRMTTKILKI